MAGATVFDSQLFGNIFGTEEIRTCFSERAYVARLIQAECALAQAEEDEGVIPEGTAAAIRAHSDVANVNWPVLAEKTEIVGYPILPLVEQMVTWVPGEAGEFGQQLTRDGGLLTLHVAAGYIHWGATTQDIMDLASTLQMKQGLEIVSQHLSRLERTLTRMSGEYREVPMAGRTHLQHALPVTFGYKCAVWLAGIRRQLRRLRDIQDTCLMVQFGGAAGTLASLGTGDAGIRVRKRLAQILSLNDPVITWHVARDTVAEVVSFLAILGGSLAKIGLDLIVMSSNELNEVYSPPPALLITCDITH